MTASPFLSKLSDIRRTPEGVLALRLLLLLGVYAVIRLVFLVDQLESFRNLTPGGVASAFVNGMRFDLSAIAYTNIPFILLSLAPTALLDRRWYATFLLVLFVAVNGALTVIMVADIGYFPFTGAHATMEIFALSREASSRAGNLLVNYAGLASMAIFLTAAMAVFYPRRVRAEPSGARPRLRRALATTAVLLLAAIAARGGLQKKPLKPIHAFASGDRAVGVLTLNTAFSLIHSPRGQPLQAIRYFATDREAEAILETPFTQAARTGASKAPPQNVVLLILESISTEYWGGANRDVALTPFLDSLSAQGTFLVDNFANGRRSMDALPSILLGVPLLMGRSIAVSGYQANEWRGLGHFLGAEGYHTSMFHGAVKGTMYFDAIASMAGIEEFYPLERFPAAMQEDEYDGSWGLFDEPAMQFAVREMGTFAQPFFSTVFTISTHHPYNVPPQYEALLPEDAKDFHRTVRYLDLSVQRFFETARQQPWYENTLFILVGDHTPPARSLRYNTDLGRYMVPMLLYHPGRDLPAVDPGRVTQHVDIFATILDYAGARPGKIPHFGSSLFAREAGEAILETNGVYWLVTREGVLERLPSGDERLLAYRREFTTESSDAVLQRPDVEAALSRRLHAYMQHYTTSMINNSFYREAGVRDGLRAQR